jgi:glutamate dehydrogenase (NAD(P)+)
MRADNPWQNAQRQQQLDLVAVYDSNGAIHNAAGLDVDRLLAHKKSTGSVTGFPGASAITDAEVLEVVYDVLVSVALENQVTSENAGRVQARLMLEAANGPLTPDADTLLEQRGITVVPGVLANAGGATRSLSRGIGFRST